MEISLAETIAQKSLESLDAAVFLIAAGTVLFLGIVFVANRLE